MLMLVLHTLAPLALHLPCKGVWVSHSEAYMFLSFFPFISTKNKTVVWDQSHRFPSFLFTPFLFLLSPLPVHVCGVLFLARWLSMKAQDRLTLLGSFKNGNRVLLKERLVFEIVCSGGADLIAFWFGYI